jgi:predicted PolB exonuclease-like 3'-5' exonuclease
VAAKYEQYKVSAWDEFVGKAALSPITGRVLMVGVVQDDSFAGIMDDNERANLTAFWELAENALMSKNRIIGHNSNGFDLPFLVRRSWMLGVHVPREIKHGRYWNPLFVDTMEAWGCGSREFIRLNDLAAAFGVGQKTEGFAGKDFHKFWFGTPEQRTEAIEYCEQDVRLTAAIAAKMGLV